jgi:DNA-binding FrmR family transcriptional regulator
VVKRSLSDTEVLFVLYPRGYTSTVQRGSMVSEKSGHVLQDAHQSTVITNRLKRAHGQLGAIVRMMEEGRECEAIVTQMAAVSKAINTAAFTLISSSLKECLTDPSVDADDVSARLQKLFLSLA